MRTCDPAEPLLSIRGYVMYGYYACVCAQHVTARARRCQPGPVTCSARYHALQYVHRSTTTVVQTVMEVVLCRGDDR